MALKNKKIDFDINRILTPTAHMEKTNVGNRKKPQETAQNRT